MIRCGDPLKVVGEKEEGKEELPWTESKHSLDITCWTDIARQGQSTLSEWLDSDL